MEINYKKIYKFLEIIIIIGLLAFIYQLHQGLVVTNMRNSFSWGLYIATWAFFVGTAAGGLVVSSSIYLFKVEALKPVAPLATITAFVFAAAAMAILLPDIGRPDRLFNIFLHPNFKSLLIWDFIVLSSYTLVSIIYAYVLMKPDIMKKGINIPFKGLIGKKEISEEKYKKLKEHSLKRAKKLAPLALPLAILIHTVTAWVLATQMTRTWWYGGLLAPTFIATALATGPAIVILFSILTLGVNHTLLSAYRVLAKISALSSIILLFMYYNEFFIRFWWHHGEDFEALKLIFTKYLHIHLIEVIFILLSAYLFFRYSDVPKKLILAGVSLIIGVFAHRFILLPPSYNIIPLRVSTIENFGTQEWSYPIAVGHVKGNLQNPGKVFVTFWNYYPSIIEILITAGIMALIVFIILKLAEILPVKENV